MNKYRIYAKDVTDVYIDIEAESQEEAEAFVKGNTEIDNLWKIKGKGQNYLWFLTHQVK